MIDKNRVKLMMSLAQYDEGKGKKDFKISEYYRKDYTSFNVLVSFIWGTIGYFLILAILGMAFFDVILKKMSNEFLLFGIVGVVIGYVFVIVLYTVVAAHVYNVKHNKARDRVKKYNHNLVKLLKLYKRNEETR
jgi:Na+/melibiose symporter-like transporter